MLKTKFEGVRLTIGQFRIRNDLFECTAEMIEIIIASIMLVKTAIN